MFESKLSPFQSFELPDGKHPGTLYARQYNTALSQFKSTLLKGRISRWKRRILHASQWLYDLNALKPELSLRGSSYSGLQVVPIHLIIGSEGRITDFDRDFHPISEGTRERWVSMAIAHLSRLPLPPIQLLQVGDAYFVRDGHHRISVSRAFGQAAMDAEVITWKAVPPFPWQACAPQGEILSSHGLDLST